MKSLKSPNQQQEKTEVAATLTMNTASRSVASIGRSWNHLSFNLIKRTLSTSSSPPVSDSASNPSTTTVSKSKRKKKKNLFEVAQFLPNWGIGYQMAKTHWSGVAYQITKINLYKDGKHGKAWGIVHKDGVPAADAAKKISGVHKRCWKYIPNSKKTEQITTQQQSEQEVQAT